MLITIFAYNKKYVFQNTVTVYTDEGVCFALNAPHPVEYIKNSSNLQAFVNIYGGKNTNFEAKNITG